MQNHFETREQTGDKHQSLIFDVSLQGHVGKVEKIGEASPYLYVERLPFDRDVMPICLSKEEYNLLLKLSQSGFVDLDEDDKKAIDALSYTLSRAQEDSPNILDVSGNDDRREGNNLDELYDMPCLGPYPQLLRIRTFKYSNNKIDVENASTDMVASRIRFVKTIVVKFLWKKPHVLNQFSMDPFDTFLARGLSTIPKAMKDYDISMGYDFDSYLGTAVWREIDREYKVNRGIGIGGAPTDSDPAETKKLSREQLDLIKGLLHPGSLYHPDGSPLGLPDGATPVDELVNHSSLISLLERMAIELDIKEQWEMLWKHHHDGFTQAEIGKAKGVSRQAVNQQLNGAIKMISDAMAMKYGDVDSEVLL